MPGIASVDCDSTVRPSRAGTWFGASVSAYHGAPMPQPTMVSKLMRPPSMIFDLELDESKQHGNADDVSSSVQDLKRFLMPLSTGEYKLRAEVEQGISKLQQAAGESDADACHKLAGWLARKGYHVHVRTALGGGEGHDCLRNLRHVFLTVFPPGAHCTTNRFIVDLSFKEQFRVAKPTPRYQALLDCLPEVYVAPEAMVPPLVNLLCQEMAAAFQAHGQVLPPWRSVSGMISKWVPRKSVDEQISTPLAPAAPLPAAGPNPLQHSSVLPPQWRTHQQPQQQVRLHLQKALDAADVATKQLSGLPPVVKPIACEPQRVLVGGNFSAIGFP